MAKVLGFFLALICVIAVGAAGTELVQNELSEQVCADGTPVVACFVDPCSTPPPEGCTNFDRCEGYYCGGCHRKYFDKNNTQICNDCPLSDCSGQPVIAIAPHTCFDGSIAGPTGRCVRDHEEASSCHWDVRTCPLPQPKCPEVMCALYCEFGFIKDSNGCDTCSCKQDCSLAKCSPISCPEGKRAVTSPNDCCPKCEPDCSAVSCLLVACAGNTVSHIPLGQCCPVCVPKPNCPAEIACAAPFCFPGQQMMQLPHQCCPSCVDQLDCKLVLCAKPECGEDEIVYTRDGECCAECVKKPHCEAVDCEQTITCRTGYESVQGPLDCCPRCAPRDRCGSTFCPRVACENSFRLKSAGDCCGRCPSCTADERHSCTSDDKLVCRPGFYAGPTCDTALPATARAEAHLRADLCPCPYTSNDDVVRRVASLTGNIDTSFIHATPLLDSQASAGCCSYRITIGFPLNSTRQEFAEQAASGVIRGASTYNSNSADLQYTVAVSRMTSDSSSLSLALASFAFLAIAMLVM